MGDVEDVMDMAKKLNMNMLEQKKYKKHIETIRYNGQKVKIWKYNNYFWQFFFFGGLFIGAIVFFIEGIDKLGVIEVGLIEAIIGLIEKYFFTTFGFMTVIAFPFMMWTGVIRSKWEGKLTRATAYCLSFLENIEHREFLELRKRRRRLAYR